MVEETCQSCLDIHLRVSAAFEGAKYTLEERRDFAVSVIQNSSGTSAATLRWIEEYRATWGVDPVKEAIMQRDIMARMKASGADVTGIQ
ncbi:hypothetical protein D779_2293 [Imhoffiella purpurea]|uniref:Uncharacterized protein n=1 Tax=Imhoffiella purpurea TaxID=1249627 RepID=W9V5G7_9GAMM|nr:hypothetical protein D779_2293 [Imhoffiella purpurea]